MPARLRKDHHDITRQLRARLVCKVWGGDADLRETAKQVEICRGSCDYEEVQISQKLEKYGEKDGPRQSRKPVLFSNLQFCATEETNERIIVVCDTTRFYANPAHWTLKGQSHVVQQNR